MPFLKLQGHYIDHRPGTVHVGTVATTLTVGDTAVEMAAPFLPIGDSLAIAPAIRADGDTGIRLDLTMWSPLRYGPELVASIPFTFKSQELAVRVARAFDDDPDTSWRDTAEQVEAWLRAQGPALGVRFS